MYAHSGSLPALVDSTPITVGALHGRQPSVSLSATRTYVEIAYLSSSDHPFA